ncbi:MAG: class I SAM-dependent methyltransferase [Bacteroidota bacterium]
MEITEIALHCEKPKIHEKGTSFMWTDEHISKQLLDIHLNPDLDLASRKMSTISSTVDWILESQKENGVLNILDLGCGPGLYAEIFAHKGHNVTGVDISRNSIDYAKKSAIDKGLEIKYINANYLDLDLEEGKYDLVMMIYTDLGVLIPEQRNVLLKMVYRVLRQGGRLIFDVLSDKDIKQKVTPKDWEVCKSGFWKDGPYLALSESFLYNEQKVILYQHTIIDSGKIIKTYRFWTHFFNFEDLKQILGRHGFDSVTFRNDILPESDIWHGDNVIFSIASKNN